MDVCLNPFAERMDALVARARRRRLSAVLVCGETNVRSLTDVACDNASGETVLLTDFRYVPAVRRTAPWLKVVDAGRDLTAKAAALAGSGACRIGYEGSIPTARFLRFKKMLPKATFVDVADEIAARVHKFAPEAIVLGNGTTSRSAEETLRTALPDVPIEIVDEYRTTDDAKIAYWKANPPKGWRRFIPTTMQVPPDPVDDYVAVILAQRFLTTEKKK